MTLIQRYEDLVRENLCLKAKFSKLMRDNIRLKAKVENLERLNDVLYDFWVDFETNKER